jgi:predicted DNA-binding transcriptional regulator AlpA
MPEVLLTRDDLRARGIKFSSSHISKLIKRGGFPAPTWLGPNTRCWPESAIDEWLRERTTARRPVLGPAKAEASRGLYTGRGRPAGSRVVDGRLVLGTADAAE